MKYGFYFVIVMCLVIGAYQVAQNKISKSLNLNHLKLGMTSEQIEEHFGTPSGESRNQLTYILQDGSELLITLRENKASSAKVKFSRPMEIQDPQMRQLTLVQMDTTDVDSNGTSWFYAGRPSEGMIYKITSEGTVESLTWVPPFTYGSHKPKQIGALLNDFKSQRSL